MSGRKLSAVIRYLQQLTGRTGANAAGDAELLERYICHRDEAAFELLIWRHGTLVFNVCRRILPREQDAEDAFQATFLAFVRKAGSIRRRGSVASWLYKVATRVALEAREHARKTAAMEKGGGEVLAIRLASDPFWSDVRPILDAELSRLPERLRRPMVLCYLEGKSNEEAARELGCRLGTIYSRLSRGRELLRQRLQRRGVTLSITGLTTVLTASAVEAAPAIPLVRAALALVDPSTSAAVSPRVATLAEGVLRSMFVTRLKIAVVMLLVLGLAAGGVWTHAWTASPQARSASDETPAKPAGDEKKSTDPITVKVAKPRQGGMALMVPRSAEVVASQQQQVVPLVAGTVKEVRVNIGDRVKQGQTLIVLDAPLLAKEVEEAMASLELAQAQVEEVQTIIKLEEARFRMGKGDAPLKSRASLNAAKAKVRLAQALLGKARIQEGFTQLKAAFDGVVTRRTIDAGNFVQPSDSRVLRPLLTVQDLDTMRFVVRAYSLDAPLVKRGLAVDIFMAGAWRGEYKISRFSPVLEGNDREMTLEIDVPNADHRLLPGMFRQVGMPFYQPAPSSLILPLPCVLPPGPLDDGRVQRFVYILRDGKAYKKNVNVVYEDRRNAVIEGIQASDVIITNKQGELKEGTPVKIEKTP